MDARLRHIERTMGAFTRAEVLDLGYDDRFIRQALKERLITRVRHGAYCFLDTWEASDAVARHMILARAVIRSLGDRVALSHTSALLAQGVALWDVDLTTVHVTRLDGASGRHEGDVVHHDALLGESDLVEHDGLLMTSGARAVLEAGTVQRTEPALVSTDSSLRLGLTDPDALAAALAAMERWPNTQHLQLVLRLADGRAESPGESRSRYLFWSCGMPSPDLQVEVRDARGTLVGVTDFGWQRYGVLGEFDGRVKYGRLLKPGQEPGEVVFEEKRREDLIREVTDTRFFRLTWADLRTPAFTSARLARMLGIAA